MFINRNILEDDMEANGFVQRLKEAHTHSEKIKIIFQYPSSDRAIVKRGKVIRVFENSFDFEDIYDGLVSFSYNFIVEIKEERA